MKTELSASKNECGQGMENICCQINRGYDCYKIWGREYSHLQEFTL